MSKNFGCENFFRRCAKILSFKKSWSGHLKNFEIFSKTRFKTVFNQIDNFSFRGFDLKGFLPFDSEKVHRLFSTKMRSAKKTSEIAFFGRCTCAKNHTISNPATHLDPSQPKTHKFLQ
jgi:hypothetical protein